MRLWSVCSVVIEGLALLIEVRWSLVFTSLNEESEPGWNAIYRMMC